MTTLTGFLLARIAEDGRRLDCGRRDHDRSRSGYLTPDCWERPFSDCDFRDKREWEAKRRIVEAADYEGVTLDYTLSCLAIPYADHPDYREEWRP